MDKRFAKTDEIKFTGTPKGYSFRWAVIAPAGVIEFCGVGSGGDIAMRSAYDQIRQKMQLEMNGKVIHRGVQFFARVNSVKKLDKAVANCISTGVKVPAKRPDIRLTLDRGRVKG
ncbi:hypothetical protein FHY55_13310 [Oceanicola sp. D3]|nr:hypothetical protein FHY55_13310 [Oceanicola sp. D3]